MRSPTRTFAAAIAAIGLFLAACGSSSNNSSAGTTAAAATTAAAPATTAAAAATTAAPAGTAAPGTAAGGAGGVTTKCDPVKAGQLTVVTSLPGPNFWGTVKAETDPDTIKSGIEFDMANDIAKACGLTMKFRNENFDAIVAGQIAADSYDIALSQVTITPERAKVVDFSVPYFNADQGLLVHKGTTVSTWDDVKKLKIGVQQATTAEADFLNNPAWKLDHDPQSFPVVR
jgi:polar amino acid transport system substrate-binding protein